MFKDSLFKKIEDKTNINKETIITIANKIQKSDMKDKRVLNDLIDNLSSMTGKKISEEKKEKIINTIIDDKVPKNIDNML